MKQYRNRQEKNKEKGNLKKWLLEIEWKKEKRKWIENKESIKCVNERKKKESKRNKRKAEW